MVQVGIGRELRQAFLVRQCRRCRENTQLIVFVDHSPVPTVVDPRTIQVRPTGGSVHPLPAGQDFLPRRPLIEVVTGQDLPCRPFPSDDQPTLCHDNRRVGLRSFVDAPEHVEQPFDFLGAECRDRRRATTQESVGLARLVGTAGRRGHG